MAIGETPAASRVLQRRHAASVRTGPSLERGAARAARRSPLDRVRHLQVSRPNAQHHQAAPTRHLVRARPLAKCPSFAAPSGNSPVFSGTWLDRGCHCRAFQQSATVGHPPTRSMVRGWGDPPVEDAARDRAAKAERNSPSRSRRTCASVSPDARLDRSGGALPPRARSRGVTIMRGIPLAPIAVESATRPEERRTAAPSPSRSPAPRCQYTARTKGCCRPTPASGASSPR